MSLKALKIVRIFLFSRWFAIVKSIWWLRVTKIGNLLMKIYQHKVTCLCVVSWIPSAHRVLSPDLLVHWIALFCISVRLNPCPKLLFSLYVSFWHWTVFNLVAYDGPFKIFSWWVGKFPIEFFGQYCSGHLSLGITFHVSGDCVKECHLICGGIVDM